MKIKNGQKFINNFYNLFYKVSNYFTKNIFGKKQGKYKIPNYYQLKFSDDFKTLNSEYWMTQMYFGRINLAYTWAFAADEACKFGENGFESHLYYNERKVEYYDDNTYNTEWDVGYLTSKIPFGYGVYEWEVILPQGERLWSAIWLTGFNSWPPEIDVTESYTDAKGRYNSMLRSNLHYGIDNDNRAQARPSHALKFSEKELLEPINFKLVFEEDKIEFYVNDFKVRRVTDKHILQWFVDEKFHIVMNNGNGYDNKLLSKDDHSVMTVKYFKYYNK